MSANTDTDPLTGGPEVWRLNVMSGTFTEPEQIEDITENYATAEHPDKLPKPSIQLPLGKLNLQLPMNRRLRSEHECETDLELDHCMFAIHSVLEAKHYHEATVGFRRDHMVDYRKARLERPKNPVYDLDYEYTHDEFTFSALGSLLIPEAMQGQATAGHILPDRFDDALLNYGGRYLPHSFHIYGGFEEPIL